MRMLVEELKGKRAEEVEESVVDDHCGWVMSYVGTIFCLDNIFRTIEFGHFYKQTALMP